VRELDSYYFFQYSKTNDVKIDLIISGNINALYLRNIRYYTYIDTFKALPYSRSSTIVFFEVFNTEHFTDKLRKIKIDQIICSLLNQPYRLSYIVFVF